MAEGRVLIVGASGQLGGDLMYVFAPSAIGVSHEEMEIAEFDRVRELVHKYRPSVVINAAANTKLDICEMDPERAFRPNAIGAYNIAKIANEIGCIVVYVSTDYVFDGKKESFAEDDVPNPLNVYGVSKLAGEMLTRVANPRSYIIRTNGLFGNFPSKKGYNFVTLMLKLAKEGKPITVVNDQFPSPTYASDLAEKIKEILNKSAPFGIYHVTNKSHGSWFDFAKMIFEIAGISPELQPITTMDRKDILKRPQCSILENKALAAIGIAPMRSLREALTDYMKKSNF
jgi:dTDP-4-dehydrorhamnose reductase